MKTQLQTAVYYIGANPKKQARLIVTEEGLRNCPPRGTRRHGTITDITGHTYKVRRASCGAPHCMCALEFCG
jgi:hypothetical protein